MRMEESCPHRSAVNGVEELLLQPESEQRQEINMFSVLPIKDYFASNLNSYTGNMTVLVDA